MQSQPIEIILNGLHKFWSRPALINVFDAQQKAPTMRLRKVIRCNGRRGVAKMQPPRRRGRKARNN